jgi:DNA-binding NarL/FixJ family response regulator
MKRTALPKAVPAPPGLVVEKLRCGDEELLVFSWEQPPADVTALTCAERDVLARVVRGATNRAIARARRTSTRTVANQVSRLLRKTGSPSRFDLIRRFAGRLDDG